MTDRGGSNPYAPPAPPPGWAVPPTAPPMAAPPADPKLDWLPFPQAHAGAGFAPVAPRAPQPLPVDSTTGSGGPSRGWYIVVGLLTGGIGVLLFQAFVALSGSRDRSRTRSERWLAALAYLLVATTVAVGCVVLVNYVRDDDPSQQLHDIVMPARFESYTRVTGTEARELTSAVRKQIPATSDLAALRTAFYLPSGRRGIPLMVMEASSRDGANQDRIIQDDPTKTVDNIAAVFGMSPGNLYATGQFGGVMRCGSYLEDRTPVCIWADRQTVGLINATGGTPADLAVVTRTFREYAEK